MDPNRGLQKTTRAPRRALVFLFLGLAVGLAGSGCGRDRAVTNVLVVSINNLRADHLSTYGYERQTDPRLALLASRGAVFEDAYTTGPSSVIGHASAFTGHYPPAHGLRNFGLGIRSQVPLLAESLADAGLETVAFVSDPLLHPAVGLSRGFELYVDCTANENVDFSNITHAQVNPGTIQRLRSAEEISSNEEVTTTFVSWLDNRNADRGFFAWVNYSDPFPQFLAPERYVEEFSTGYEGMITGNIRYDPRVHLNMDPIDRDRLRALYDAEVLWTDSHMGNCLDRLHEQGLLDQTLIVVFSPFGQPFLEHGTKIPGSAVFEHDIRVPLVMVPPDAWTDAPDPALPPGEESGAKRYEGPVSLVAVAPTILDAVGLDPWKGTIGKSLWSSVRGARAFEPRTVYFEVPLGQVDTSYGMIEGTTKLVRRASRRKVWHLGDLVQDPVEKNCEPIRAASDPRAERLEGLREALEQYGKALESSEPVPAELRKALEAFGL